MSLNNLYDDWARGDPDKALDTQTGKLAYDAMSFAFRWHLEELKALDVAVRKVLDPNAGIDKESIRFELARFVYTQMICLLCDQAPADQINLYAQNLLRACENALLCASITSEDGPFFVRKISNHVCDECLKRLTKATHELKAKLEAK